ncbi:MAG: hypothetical protein WA009_01860, partial [Phototrophicaceae bacterium]
MLEGFSFPVLSAIIWVPIIAGVVILFIDAKQRDLVRGVAISAATIVLALSFLVFFTYNSQVQQVMDNQDLLLQAGGSMMGTQMFVDGLAFVEHATWIESLGISYHLAVDGLSAPMV